MLREATWRWGFLIGVLVLLWTISYPFLGQAGIFPRLNSANIGAGFLLIAPFGLALCIAVVLALVPPTRLFSFGLAIPLLALQVGLILLTLLTLSQTSPLGPLVVVFVNLPGCLALLVVGIAYYASRGARLRGYSGQ